METVRKLVCTKPFEWFEVQQRKLSYPVFLCCGGWMPKPVGDLTTSSPIDVWRSNEAIEVRTSVLDGSFRFCNAETCPHLTAVTGPVKYVGQKDYLELCDRVGGETFMPEELNCSYDKSCNLSCPSCRATYVMAKGGQRTIIDRIGKAVLEDFGKELKSIYITGSGDPFASKHFLQMLTSGVLQQHPNLQLHLHTNGQLFNEEAWKKLKVANQQIDILEVSIDAATKTTYEENRRPGNWETLLTNMRFLAQLKKDGKIRQFKISFVVQTNNHKEMAEFVRLGREWNTDIIYFSPLNDWGSYSPDEFLYRSIHRKEHPQHESLLHELSKIELSANDVELGYFRRFY